MNFHSAEFVLLLGAVGLLYFTLPVRLRNPVLLAASATFYMWWRPEYILLVLFSVTIDYAVALGLDRTDKPVSRRLLLAASLVSNLGLLFFFKYFEFSAHSIRAVLGVFHVPFTPPALNVLLPVGISFYTFQALSYTIDVYRKEVPAERRFGRLCLYVLFFPQLVAGPIERSGSLLPQFESAHAFDADRAVSGLRLVLWGLVKKVAIADRLAQIADAVYQNPAPCSGEALLLGTYAFAFQIYADFSAYSDIAIGSARILGFRLMQNFNEPYLAESPADFWKRWHISLSTWFRDYVYIPLGGNRAGKGRWLFAVMATFLLSGLWHGARWTFVAWGAYHGLLFVLWVAASRLPVRAPGRWIRILLTFHLVLVGWVLFRSRTGSDAVHVLTHAFAFSAPKTPPLLEHLRLGSGALAWAALGVLALFIGDRFRRSSAASWPPIFRWAAYIAGCLIVLNARVEADTPFIYFRF